MAGTDAPAWVVWSGVAAGLLLFAIGHSLHQARTAAAAAAAASRHDEQAPPPAAAAAAASRVEEQAPPPTTTTRAERRRAARAEFRRANLVGALARMRSRVQDDGAVSGLLWAVKDVREDYADRGVDEIKAEMRVRAEQLIAMGVLLRDVPDTPDTSPDASDDGDDSE